MSSDHNKRASRRSLRILLPTLGSAGDVFPTLALGSVLQERGHRVTVVTNEIFAEPIRAAGVDFLPMGTAEEWKRMVQDQRLWDPWKSFACLAQHLLLPNISRLFEIIAGQAGPNLVVAAPGTCLGARIAQEKLGVHLATLHLQPVMIRSLVDAGRQGRLPMGPKVPRQLKKLLFFLMDQGLVRRHLLPGVNQFRSHVGLGPIDDIFGSFLHSPELIICMFPEWFAQVQPDWPRQTHQTGFALFDGDGDSGAEAEAQAFLEAGPPPVLFTAGSAANGEREFFEECIEACRITGQRGILVTSFPEQLPDKMPESMRAFRYLRFSRIFPGCATIVHHGGVGTLAQATHAGVPQLVVPRAYDQPDNAARVEQLGLGRSIYLERFKAKAVSRLLQEISGSSSMRERCQYHAKQIDTQSTLERTSQLIETLCP